MTQADADTASDPVKGRWIEWRGHAFSENHSAYSIILELNARDDEIKRLRDALEAIGKVISADGCYCDEEDADGEHVLTKESCTNCHMSYLVTQGLASQEKVK